MATQITPHFTMEEMLTSQTAIRFRYSEQFTPPNNVKQSLTALCQHVLEPIRVALAKPIRVSSGYRCLRVNTKIGGARNSQHIDGEAADIQVLSMTVEELYQFIKAGNFPYDQLIQEFDSWVHVSFGPRNRRQSLRAVKLGNGHTKYLPG
ncbi:D-Ala-D-Ala carboxypeptidase family metallohydrolase [Dyadobacter sp. LHD-138]|uniref:D-Ala-D-Ala carboxypeptidase family metallohydrolase n=1 Tax=Dyadobacter sp. LHD-138 TaxID=3071413 RepID=UPI0027E1BAB9|nr:D-Ala-D-Ala carboxypeptidase family metallohydrolase [Dyadobacter sp. LHD-138]MDQ6479773.1 D-Ala-D-Ala carboxypeptidase family metallohydrolase [Dyadobacter sp. LHD-138]